RRRSGGPGGRGADQGTARYTGAPRGGRGWRRHRVPRLPGGRGAISHAGLLLGVPVVPRHADAWHREHAAPLCAGSGRGRTGRILSPSSFRVFNRGTGLTRRGRAFTLRRTILLPGDSHVAR